MTDKLRTDCSEKKSSRRILLGATAALVTLPSAWQKPVVKSVLIPAHAATSVIVGNAPTSGDFFGDIDDQIADLELAPNIHSEQELLTRSSASPLDFLVAEANANGSFTHLCIAVNNGAYQADFQFADSYLTASGMVGDPLVTMTEECPGELIFFSQIAVNSIGANGNNVNITFRFGKNDTFDTTIPRGVCNFDFGCVAVGD